MNEFVCVWFEEPAGWKIVFPNGQCYALMYPAIGYAVNAAIAYLGGGESDWDCEEETGTFYRYFRVDEND